MLFIVKHGILEGVAKILRAEAGVLKIELLEGHRGDVESTEDDLNLVRVESTSSILDLGGEVCFGLVDRVMTVGEG